MPFLISEDISEIIDERTRILKEFDEAKNKATQLHKHSSQIVHNITGVDTSVQIPAQLTDKGTPPTELLAALASLETELEKIENAQREINTYEVGIKREIENRRNTIIIGGLVTITVVAVAVFSIFFSKQTPIETEQATISAKSTTTATTREPTLTFTRTPKSGITEETTLASTFPLKVTPVAVTTDAKPLAVDFLIDNIEVGEDNIKFNISIKRHAGNASLSWHSDEDRENDIYLEVGSQHYDLIDMGGIFTQDTTLQAGHSYQGRFTFEKPDGNLFTFHYPDIKPLEIDLEKLDVKTEVTVSEASTSTPRPTTTPRPTRTPSAPKPTNTPVLDPVVSQIWEQAGDLGDLINSEDEQDVISQPFQGGMMLLRNEQLVYVLYNDGRWQPFGDDIFGSLADWRLLSWEQGAQLQHSSARQFVGVWLHLGAANSELGLALKPSTPPAFPKTDEMVDYENGIIFISERLGQYILYNSGQWAQPGEASVGQPAPTNTPETVAVATATQATPTQCSIQANPEITKLWGDQLGCAIGPQQAVTYGAEQAMQGGHLFWRKDTDELYAIGDRNKQTGEELFAGEAIVLPKLAAGESVCVVDKAPPPGTPPMVRGFSWWWCQYGGGPDGPLGWPLDQEYGRENTFLFQPFENGFVWKGSDPKIYALFYNGKFLAYRP